MICGLRVSGVGGPSARESVVAPNVRPTWKFAREAILEFLTLKTGQPVIYLKDLMVWANFSYLPCGDSGA